MYCCHHSSSVFQRYNSCQYTSQRLCRHCCPCSRCHHRTHSPLSACAGIPRPDHTCRWCIRLRHHSLRVSLADTHRPRMYHLMCTRFRRRMPESCSRAGTLPMDRMCRLCTGCHRCRQEAPRPRNGCQRMFLLRCRHCRQRSRCQSRTRTLLSACIHIPFPDRTCHSCTRLHHRS